MSRRGFPCVAGSCIEEGGQDPCVQTATDPLFEMADRFKEFLNAIHREKTRFEGHDHVGRGAKGIEGEEVQCGGAVDDNEIIGARERLDQRLQSTCPGRCLLE